MAMLLNGSVVLADGATERGVGSVLRIDEWGRQIDVIGVDLPSGDREKAIVLTHVAPTDDGGFIAAGEATRTESGAFDFALVRFLADGSPDLDFGRGGLVVKHLGPRYAASALLANTDGSIATVGTMEWPGRSLGVIFLFDSVGKLDPSFGHGGMSLFHHEAKFGRALAALLTSGQLIVVGSQEGDGGVQPAYAARPLDRASHSAGFLDRDRSPGQVDPRLLRPGKFTAAGVDASGRILMAGRLEDGHVHGVALARTTKELVLDTSFARSGVSITPLQGDGGCATSLDVDQHDRVVVTAETVRRDGLVVLRFVNPPALPGANRPTFRSPEALRGDQDSLLRKIQMEHEIAMQINRGIY